MLAEGGWFKRRACEICCYRKTYFESLLSAAEVTAGLHDTRRARQAGSKAGRQTFSNICLPLFQVKVKGGFGFDRNVTDESAPTHVCEILKKNKVKWLID